MRPIDKTSSIPYYLQLAEILRQDIGERPSPHEIHQLPSENELATLQGITRATVRRALDVLERDGWIYREKGKGSFAAVRRERTVSKRFLHCDRRCHIVEKIFSSRPLTSSV